MGGYLLEVALWVAISGGAGALTYFGLHAWRSDARRTRRVLRRTRVVRIADLVDGQLACIVGVVELEGEPVEAVVTRRPCVAFETTLQIFPARGRPVVEGVEVIRHMKPFFVSDGTGRVRVDAAEAALCNRPIARTDQLEERILEDGATVRLAGSVSLEPTIGAGERGFRESALKATITGTAKYPLLVDVVDR